MGQADAEPSKIGYFQFSKCIFNEKGSLSKETDTNTIIIGARLGQINKSLMKKKLMQFIKARRRENLQLGISFYQYQYRMLGGRKPLSEQIMFLHFHEKSSLC